MSLKKGTVQSFDGTHAVIVPNDCPGIVTLPLLVPFFWRALLGNLQQGQEVYYMEDNAHGGLVLSTTEGAWDATLRGTLNVTEDVTVTGGVTAGGSMSAEADVTAGGISLKSHTHKDSQGGTTSAPNS